MEENMEVKVEDTELKYKRKEFEDLTGISYRTLLNWEKQGLLVPVHLSDRCFYTDKDYKKAMFMKMEKAPYKRRPTSPSSRLANINIRLSFAEKEQLEQQAKEQNLTLSTYVHQLIFGGK